MTAPEDTRPQPAGTASERDTVLGFLNFQRATLAWKCAGLSAEQLARRASPPSTLSLLGLLRHLAEVERSWFRHLAGEHVGQPGDRVPYLYATAEEPDLDLDGAVADPEMVSRAYADWQAEIAHADAIIAAASFDDTLTHRTGELLSLRWILLHMIEEYARHNGHADLLREALDGARGE
ncbi:MAG: DUF664 domain-containing protein [Actinobacteria bacterium]|nr:DUF664 domain-containing protein [Actinomycetota bacterium]